MEFANGPYYSVGRSATRWVVRGSIMNNPFSRCATGDSGGKFRMVRALPTDDLPDPRGQSAWYLRTVALVPRSRKVAKILAS
jgi:hypothetical protein